MESYGFNAWSDSAIWPTANLALFIPLYLPESITTTKLFWGNGDVVSGNVDMGIYQTSGTRLASTGSTAQAGTSGPQSVALATTLPTGTYYLALAMNNITGRMTRSTGVNVGLARAAGMMEQASAFPLPAAATFATLTTNYVPSLGLVLRSQSP